MQKATINKLVFTDVFKCAKDKLEKKNRKVNRYRRLVRERKEQSKNKRILGECQASSQAGAEGPTQLIAGSIKILQNIQKPMMS